RTNRQEEELGAAHEPEKSTHVFTARRGGNDVALHVQGLQSDVGSASLRFQEEHIGPFGVLGSLGRRRLSRRRGRGALLGLGNRRGRDGHRDDNERRAPKWGAPFT